MRYFIILLAALFLPASAHARPIVWGGTPCTNAAVNGDGCYNGGSTQHPDFFRGYATQGSAGTSYPAGASSFVSWTAASSLQPTVYPVRPPWNVAAVDYAVGMPRWQKPTLANLSGQPWLKDPAQIASDPLVNPDGPGANCNFYLSNIATGASGAAAAGGTANPFPFPNDGPGIYCKAVAKSTQQIIFDGYNFAWNSSTGYGCVPVYLVVGTVGTAAAQNSAATASIIFRNSLFVNGPKCNIWGAVGNGTNQGGPNSPSSAAMIINGLSGTIHNTLGFYNNTVYGCGGDSHADALETALCSASFNATSYNSGSLTGFVQNATVGVAPVESIVINFGGTGTMWVQDNAFLHMTSRFSNPDDLNLGGGQIFTNNYIEGLTYNIGPVGLQFTSIVNSGGTTETATTLNPHGIPVGSNWLIALSGNGAAGWPSPAWPSTFTMTATGASTLTFTSPTNYGDWTYSGSGNYPTGTAGGNHGEFTEPNGSLAGATFTGTISGTTLTVSGLTGTLAVGQYVTAATGSGLSIPSPTYIVSGSGSTWTLNQAPGNVSGAMVSPYYTIGAQGVCSTVQISYNTWLQTPSAAGDANTAFFYISTGGGYASNGIPLVQFCGSIDHNVFVNDLSTGLTHRSTSALVELAYNQNGALAITSNYVDPTGAFYCWEQLEEGPSSGPLTLANNVNMLSPSDPYVNQQDAYSIVPYVAGTKSNTQAQNGISYNASTGQVTVTLSNANMPAAIAVGALVSVNNTSVSTGTNYLAGLHTVTGVSGNTFTFTVAAGYPGTPTGASPIVVPYVSSGVTQTCYGHN